MLYIPGVCSGEEGLSQPSTPSPACMLGLMAEGIPGSKGYMNHLPLLKMATARNARGCFSK